MKGTYSSHTEAMSYRNNNELHRITAYPLHSPSHTYPPLPLPFLP